MTKAILDGDLVVGVAEGDIVGIDIPKGFLSFPADRLRHVNGAIVDAVGFNRFYIDDRGRKHVDAADGLFALDCSWNDVLIASDAGWIVQDDAARLQAVKVTLCVAIDAEAERRRRQYITPGLGQALVYQRKGFEALMFKQWRAVNPDLEPVISDYPLMAASIGSDGATLDDVASSVLLAESVWLAAAAAIEAVRLGGKASVAACTDAAQARLMAAAIVWP